jgi:[acyl-carrier-protein] S-malonyltransferase
VLSNLAKRLPNIEKAFAIDTKGRMEDALNAVLVAEGKIA